MKSRVISVIVIAAYVIGVCVFTSVYTEKFADTVTKNVREIYKDREEAILKIADLDEKWDKYGEVAALYIYHDEIEKVASLISGLRESYEDAEILLKINCKEIELMMEHISESQKPMLNNIF